MKKICQRCRREFDWRDIGNSVKFEQTNLCPDCEHEIMELEAQENANAAMAAAEAEAQAQGEWEAQQEAEAQAEYEQGGHP